MKRTLATGAAAVLLAAGAVTGANAASELTQQRDGGSADVAFNTNVPGSADTAFSAPEYEGTDERVPAETRRALVQMAVEAGQTSSKSDEQGDGAETTPPGVGDHADGYFGRLESRGVSVGEG